MEPGMNYQCGCFIALIAFWIIWASIFGRGFWLNIPWPGYGCPGYYVDTEYLGGDDWTPDGHNWWKKEPEIPPPNFPPSLIKANVHFVDETLEGMIAEGRLIEAREYLRGMIDIAKEMKDRKCELNYKTYEKKIVDASMKPRLGNDYE